MILDYLWNSTGEDKAKCFEENPVPMTLCPPQSLLGLPCDSIRASTVKGGRLNHGTPYDREKIYIHIYIYIGFEVFVMTNFDNLLSCVVCSVEMYIHRTAYHSVC